MIEVNNGITQKNLIKPKLYDVILSLVYLVLGNIILGYSADEARPGCHKIYLFLSDKIFLQEVFEFVGT